MPVQNEDQQEKIHIAIGRLRVISIKQEKLLLALQDCLHPFIYKYVADQLTLRLQVVIETLEEAIDRTS